MRKSEQISDSDVGSLLGGFFAREIPSNLPPNPMPPTAESMVGWKSGTGTATATRSQRTAPASTKRFPQPVRLTNSGTQPNATHPYAILIVGTVAMLCTALMLGRSITPRANSSATLVESDSNATTTGPDTLVTEDEIVADSQAAESAEREFDFSQIFRTENGPVELRAKMKLRKVSVGDGATSPQLDFMIPELDVEFVLEEPLPPPAGHNEPAKTPRDGSR